ncbi:hypothetical protein [Photobacterium lutimaris]|uniref:Uncharacterized protein n=1 Tax=Photobacterium lutimaris TaxID=388278 RepID=A0A2T3ITS9_9GAMM|nr:hypothetical protein [Photobacterium lutimaris]PSU31767.1 hypothetical protein C9I99_21525 [Photobacterium lutimaris]TDR72582.1 hypothetical protein DFP78_11358 [Photobacterium lutimaris]
MKIQLILSDTDIESLRDNAALIDGTCLASLLEQTGYLRSFFYTPEHEKELIEIAQTIESSANIFHEILSLTEIIT